MELFNNTGRVAMVTGGGSGIGKTAAEALSESGATVAIIGRTLEKVEAAAAEIQEKTGNSVKGYQGDVTNTEDIKRFVQAIYEDLGQIDILVNNAGTLAPGLIDSLDEAGWDHVMNTNAKSIFFTTQAVVPYMKEQNYGRIINTASVAGEVSLSFSSVYGTSKAAAIHQTKQLSLELAPYNITVNAISPWFFKTEMNESDLEDEDFRTAVENRSPMKRLGQLEELKSSYLFFASAGSSYVSGQNIFVDGGMTVYGL
ncbi:2-deoxy-D-gluconate 3-dehydrogenase [Pontibacillus halophilus JSM 076056 = DSM 19796]|uniref:2-deoxy-D-gluconate 3-dehydrogenase n=1 Tax=Pontibacillus halophilus JSM 076056 = DSM 19796 TaxID=1385510 RepID=A0A0A5GK74_9BACI|nr:SDR family oxidoreductase [Pontibacillus halophilus]KGX92404.1 2-deoxy-D-gluconate 3-dehydrogenase [Pontibacillus halophilus JSM 076056 = DSM 19796]